MKVLGIALLDWAIYFISARSCCFPAQFPVKAATCLLTLSIILLNDPKTSRFSSIWNANGRYEYGPAFRGLLLLPAF